MAKKVFTFRGKSLEELKGLSTKELAALLPARQRRTLLRGFTEEQTVFLSKLNSEKQVKTHCRDMIVLPLMVGKTIRIHNGKEFVSVIIQAEMIGHYLGEFAMTRRKVGHHAPGLGATRSSSNVGAR